MMTSTGVRALRHRFIVADPARFAGLCAAAGLFLLPETNFLVVLLIAGLTQFSALDILWRGRSPGWSAAGGRRVREAVYASSLAMDLTTLSVSTLAGALLLAKLFGGAVGPLALLAAGVCFLPDVRLCRLVLAGDPQSASRQLRDGWSFRDPVAWGAALTGAAVLALDPASLAWVVLSLGIFHLNALLVLLDKYVPEIEGDGWRALFDREGRRLAVALAAVSLAPIRHFGGDGAATWTAGLIGAVLVLPDLARGVLAAARGVDAMFRVTPPTPATFVVLPKG
jgi:hypothetical protein